MNTPSTPRLLDRRRAAVQLASGHIIYRALRITTSCREMTDRDRLILALGRHAAEPLYAFEVDVDALLSGELVETHRLACDLLRRRAGCARRRGEPECLRRLWRKAVRYLSRPDVKRVLDELVREACLVEASVEADLSLLVAWHRRRLHLPDFDGIVTRAAERDRQLMIKVARRELAQLGG